MKGGMAFLMLSFVFITNPDTRIVLLERISLSQEETIQLYSDRLSVTEDEIFIVPDALEGNIKLYDNFGKLIDIWGRKGPGPGEFGSPALCDYQESRLALMDLQKRKVIVYERTEGINFKKVDEFRCLGLGYDIKLINDQLLISGFITTPKRREFDLYIRDLKTKKIQYLLPSERKYGFKSFNKYREEYQNNDNIVSIGIQGFCSFAGEYIYFTWEGDLKILKIDRKTGVIEFFGKKTAKYIQPKATESMIKARFERKRGIAIKEKQKMSYIVGIFADENFVGLLYANFDKDTSLWQMILQLYSPDGKLLKEAILPEAVSYDMAFHSFYYNKKKNILYYLSKTLDEETYTDKITILKYMVTLK